MKIRYNAPVTLTFALISAVVLFLDKVLGTNIINAICVAPPKGHFITSSPLSYIRLFSHVIGHADWNHLLSNFAFILLLGPILEEKYGSLSLFIMVAITALITGFSIPCYFPQVSSELRV